MQQMVEQVKITGAVAFAEVYESRPSLEPPMLRPAHATWWEYDAFRSSTELAGARWRESDGTLWIDAYAESLGFHARLEGLLERLSHVARQGPKEAISQVGVTLMAWAPVMALEDAEVPLPAAYASIPAYQALLYPVAGSIRKVLQEAYANRPSYQPAIVSSMVPLFEQVYAEALRIY